jgi:acyl-CoA reductase-like NAD-dependent aldehyde dehydrogenase
VRRARTKGDRRVTEIQALTSIVDGRERAGPGKPLPDLNPARPDQQLALVHQADEALVGEAIEAARRSFEDWRRRSARERGEILRHAGDLLEGRADEIGSVIAREEGKTLREGIGETKRAAAIFRYFSAQTLGAEGEIYPADRYESLLLSRREPLGVVTVITPWNFPIAIPSWKIAPALAFGNTIVWKPAELVPITAARVADVLQEAGLPDGVFNLVLGRGGEVGEVLVSHPDVDAVTFTGSNDVGRTVQLTAIEHGKRVQAEMGGKNPAIVLADADLMHAAEQVARGAFLSAGQKCTATSRVIVEEPIFDEFSERLTALANSWTVGDPLDEATDVGPLASSEQMRRVLGYLELAAEEGATALAGGGHSSDRDGYFLDLTLLTGVGPDSRVMNEEIFGPVAMLVPAKSFEEAIHLANDTPFGLSASLFTTNLGRALRFAREIRAGVVKVNQESAGIEPHLPFGGMKGSSNGWREQGTAAKEFFTEWKSVYIDPDGGLP